MEKESDNIISFLNTHCSLAISTYQSIHRVLYSGIYNTPEKTVTLTHSPTFRKPRGLTLKEQTFIDTCLQLHQFNALRSNSSYVIEDFNAASHFGTVCYIFPVDGFYFTWSLRFKYFNNNVFNEFIKPRYKKYYNIPANSFSKISPKIAQQFIDDLEYYQTDFKAAVKSKHEIMIHGNYAVIIANENGKKIVKQLNIVLPQEF
jgi:hypothetical protein